MKTIVSLVVAFALTLSVIPAMAGDTFQAFSKMSTDEQALLPQMADLELEAVEGGVDVCVVCIQRVRIRQTNVNVGGAAIQVNNARVRQDIN